MAIIVSNDSTSFLLEVRQQIYVILLRHFPQPDFSIGEEYIFKWRVLQYR